MATGGLAKGPGSLGIRKACDEAERTPTFSGETDMPEVAEGGEEGYVMSRNLSGWFAL